MIADERGALEWIKENIRVRCHFNHQNRRILKMIIMENFSTRKLLR
jgi:hypothetical protein